MGNTEVRDGAAMGFCSAGWKTWPEHRPASKSTPFSSGDKEACGHFFIESYWERRSMPPSLLCVESWKSKPEMEGQKKMKQGHRR